MEEEKYIIIGRIDEAKFEPIYNLQK